MTRPVVRIGSLVAVAALIFAACGSDTGESDSTLPSTQAPTTTSSPGGDADLETDAISRIEAFQAALSEGRVDDMAEIFGQELSDGDRLLWEFNATLEQVYPSEFGACEVTQSVGSLIMVECAVRFTDPVHIATGVADVIHPYRYQDGVITWHTMRAAEGLRSPFAGSAAVAEYLELFHPDDHEACSPASYTGAFVYNGHLALVPPCAEVFVTHAPDIAEWVEAGRPAQWEG